MPVPHLLLYYIHKELSYYTEKAGLVAKINRVKRAGVVILTANLCLLSSSLQCCQRTNLPHCIWAAWYPTQLVSTFCVEKHSDENWSDLIFPLAADYSQESSCKMNVDMCTDCKVHFFILHWLCHPGKSQNLNHASSCQEYAPIN